MNLSRELEELRLERSMGVGRLFLLARRDFSSRLAKKVADEFKSPNTAVLGGAILPFLDLSGTRSTELAKRSGISKQAVAQALKELESAGYIKREPDPTDGRAQVICFTNTGVDYLRRIHTAIRAVEQEYMDLLGAERVNQLRRDLGLLIHSEQTQEHPEQE